MNADQEHMKMLLTETIALLCQRGLTFTRELHVQGLLGITVDDDVFLVPVDERTSKQPLCVIQETEGSFHCDSLPQQNHPAVHQMAPSEVPAVKRDFLSAAGNQTPFSRHPVVINKPGILTATKTEIVDIDDIDSSTENEIEPLNSRSNENVSASEPVNHPVQFQQSFPAAALGFRGSTSVAQVHATSDEVKYDGKRKRRQSTFGDDMLILSPDNDEWTNSSHGKVEEPAAGWSQWTHFVEEPQHDTAVSIYRT